MKVANAHLQRYEGLSFEEAVQKAFQDGFDKAMKKKAKITAATRLWVLNRYMFIGPILKKNTGKLFTVNELRKILKDFNMLDMPNKTACMGNLMRHLKNKGRIEKTGRSRTVIHEKGHSRQCYEWRVVK